MCQASRRIVPLSLVIACGLAASLGGLAAAQSAAPPGGLHNGGVAPFQGKYTVLADGKVGEGDLLGLARVDGASVFDAELIAASVAPIEGTRLLGTTYVFAVHEWFRGDRRQQVVTYREVGGENPDGTGMSTCQSHKLVVGGRYLVFARPDAKTVNLPFDRVLQILDHGNALADEGGRVVVDAANGRLTTRRSVQVQPARYNAGGHDTPVSSDAGAPTWSSETLPGQPPKPRDPEAMAAVPASTLLDQLRGGPNTGAMGPMGLPGPDQQVGTDWTNCGYPPGLRNFAYWLPNTAVLPWFDDSMFYWNQLVAAGGSSGYMYGRFVGGGGQPTTNTLPVGNNGTQNAGTPADAQMTAGGYGTWAANGSPNGICFQWYDSSCGNIRETDVFVNPSNNGNELQFRKSCVHELGHAYAANHEDRFVAIMVSGTWRVVPGYGTNAYIRADDVIGARQAMSFRNGITPNTFNLANFRDIATSGQAHPNAGSSGDIGTFVSTVSPTFLSTGQTLNINRIYVENRGPLAYTGTVTIRAYLSSDTNITSGDFLLGSATWPSFGGTSASNNFNLAYSIPASVPTGSYYVGWIVSSPEAQLDGSNDRALVTRDSGSGFSPVTVSVSNTVPSNDACGSAQTITAGSWFGSTTTATSDGATFCGTNTGKDVWFNWTAPCPGTVTLSTCGSNFDTVLSIYANGCASTSALDCNDDSNVCVSTTGRQSYLGAVPVTGGQTYLIRVAGYNLASGNYQLNVDFSPNIPTNTLCPAAIPLVGSAAVFGSTQCGSAGVQTNSCGSSNTSPEVWYVWTPLCTGEATVGTCASPTPYDTVIGAWDACPSLGGTQIACDDDGCGLPLSKISFPVTAGVPVWLRVSGYNGAAGVFRMEFDVSTPAPANDDCTAPIPIADGGVVINTCGATDNGDTFPDCPVAGINRPLGKNQWYVYTAKGNGPVSVNFCDADYDSLIAVFSACPGVGSPLACNDDSCGTSGLASSLTFNATAGQEYLISAGGFSTAVGTGTLTITGPVACYADCDGSGGLSPADFTCFLGRYRTGAPYADCDTSGGLSPADFTCFLSKYRAGCP